MGVVAALLAGVPAVPLNPKTGERELAHILADSAPSLVLAEPGAELPPALSALPRMDIELTGPGAPRCPSRHRALRRPRAVRRVARPDRLHLRHHGPAQGRRAPAPGDHLHPGRPGGRLAVDGRRRARPRPPAVPCPRADPGRPRPAAPRRRGAASGAVQHRGRGARAGVRARRCSSACRRCTTASPRPCPAIRGSPRRWPGPGCWSPVRPRCPCTTMSGSPRRPAAGSSSGTG